MSPDMLTNISDVYSFPRVSGDEPSPLTVGVALSWFSPRERG